MKPLLLAISLLAAAPAAAAPPPTMPPNPQPIPHADSNPLPPPPLTWRADHLAIPNPSSTTLHFTSRLTFYNHTPSPIPLPCALLQTPDLPSPIPFDPPTPLPPVPPHASLTLLYLEDPALPATLYPLYDGARFDRFPRSPRTDWAYGTASSPTVSLHLSFRNTTAKTLPPGPLHLLRYTPKHPPQPLGLAPLPPLRPHQEITLNLGPAANLSGTRLRTACNEIVPGLVFEETFTITLSNQTPNDTLIRVVEHLYRGGLPSITSSDFPYTPDGPASIRFNLPVKAGAQKTITYTAHYNW